MIYNCTLTNRSFVTLRPIIAKGVFDAGKIIDEGRHEELIDRDGLYRDLYSSH